jgi:hypothetical protein
MPMARAQRLAPVVGCGIVIRTNRSRGSSLEMDRRGMASGENGDLEAILGIYTGQSIAVNHSTKPETDGVFYFLREDG